MNRHEEILLKAVQTHLLVQEETENAKKKALRLHGKRVHVIVDSFGLGLHEELFGRGESCYVMPSPTGVTGIVDFTSGFVNRLNFFCTDIEYKWRDDIPPYEDVLSEVKEAIRQLDTCQREFHGLYNEKITVFPWSKLKAEAPTTVTCFEQVVYTQPPLTRFHELITTLRRL